MRSSWLKLKRLRTARRSPPVSAVMTPRPETALEDETLPAAAERMRSRGIRHLPILDAGGRLVGMLSDRDVRSHHATAATVAEAMTRDPRVAYAREPITELLDVFIADGYGAIPVLTPDRHLAGIVSYVDLLRWIRGDR
jgi:CBS domain-containing protein